MEMLQKEQPWQALLDSAGEGIWGVDLEGTCTFVNRAALAMLGFPPEELVGQNMHDMIHHHYPDGAAYPAGECIVYQVYLENRPFTNRVDHLFRKDGSLFWAEMSAQPIVDDGRVRGAVVTFRDITATRLAEAALRRSEKLAAVGQLASSIAHEINNPLEAVMNLLYLVRTGATIEEVKGFAAQAEMELARVADVTTQTLRFHKQQSRAAPANLSETIAAILRLYAVRFSARAINLELRLRRTPATLLYEGDFRQVLNHLVRNAYDAMPHGGTLRVRLQEASRGGEPGIRITVADTGSGFLPEMRLHLFEPFYTSKEATGTGLGLWISKGIVDKHGGSIRMRSRQGQGTVFSVWLPLTPGLNASIEARGIS